MIESAFYQYIVAQSIIAGEKVHYEKLQFQGQTDYFVYSVIDQARPLNIDNSSSKRRAGFQLDIYSKDIDTLQSLRDATVLAFHGQGFAIDGHIVQHCFVESEISGFEEESEHYRIALTINVYFD